MFTPEWFRSCREEITAPVGGANWRMHKTDGDRWPSSPHAIDIQTGNKLHLRTGEIFSPQHKRVGKLKWKKFGRVLHEFGLIDRQPYNSRDLEQMIAQMPIA